MAGREPVSHPSFDDELRQIGLEAEWVREAVGNGNQERIRVLGYHNAPSAQGFCAWNGILASLTITTHPFGWVRRDPRSLPVLIHDELKHLLFVSSGDEYTGLRVPGKKPRSRRPKGSMVRMLADQNKELAGTPLPIDIELPAEQRYMQEVLGYTSYVLLVHFSRVDCQARYEVSPLADIDSRSYLTVGGGRIIFPPYELSPEDFTIDDVNDFDGPDDFDVPEKG